MLGLLDILTCDVLVGFALPVSVSQRFLAGPASPAFPVLRVGCRPSDIHTVWVNYCGIEAINLLQSAPSDEPLVGFPGLPKAWSALPQSSGCLPWRDALPHDRVETVSEVPAMVFS